MKKFSFSKFPLKAVGCSTFAALLLGASSSHAQVTTAYSTNFDNLDKTSALAGQDGWTDNDPMDPNGVVVAAGYSNGSKDLLGFVGGGAILTDGISPSVSPSNVTHGFTPTTSVYSFTTDFIVSSSVTVTAGTAPSQDAFAFTFKNAAGNNVYSVDFAPSTTSGVDALRYTTYNTLGASNGQTSTGMGITLDSRYHLVVSANVVTESFSITVQPETPLGALSGTAFTQNVTVPVGSVVGGIASFSATDIVSNLAAPGTNSLLFDNLSAVPEPSTYAMLGLGLAGLAFRFRRKARA